MVLQHHNWLREILSSQLFQVSTLVLHILQQERWWVSKSMLVSSEEMRIVNCLLCPTREVLLRNILESGVRDPIVLEPLGALAQVDVVHVNFQKRIPCPHLPNRCVCQCH